MKHFIYLLISLALSVQSIHAQDDYHIKVKKAGSTPEFYYKGKPVAPQALERMFPSLGDPGHGADTVDLRLNPFLSNSYRDTTNYYNWASSSQKQREFRSDLLPSYYRSNYKMDSLLASTMGSAFTNYIVLGTTTGGKFIVLSFLNGGGTLTQCFVFVLDIRGDLLIRLGYAEINNVRDFAVEIKGNTIVCDTMKYEIPMSAR